VKIAAYQSRRREDAGKPASGYGERERGGQRSQAHPTPVAASSPILWPCLCGARNRLRDTTCRACGDYKPEAHK